MWKDTISFHPFAPQHSDLCECWNLKLSTKFLFHQEPRLGRWGRVRSAQNGVAIHPIRLKDEKEDL
jgi:hypothetical protein